MTQTPDIPVQVGDELIPLTGIYKGRAGTVVGFEREPSRRGGPALDTIVLEFPDGVRAGYTAGELTYDDTPERPAPASRFFTVKEWARANRLGENTVYEFCRRQRDPLPHIMSGRRRKLIDDELAVEWMRRNLGVKPVAR